MANKKYLGSDGLDALVGKIKSEDKKIRDSVDGLETRLGGITLNLTDDGNGNLSLDITIPE